MKRLTIVLTADERRLLRELLLQAALDGNEVRWASSKMEASAARFLIKKLELLP